MDLPLVTMIALYECVRHRHTQIATVITALAIAATPSTQARAQPGVHSDGRSAYIAITPCRLADTRDPDSTYRVVDEATIRVQITGRCLVSASASTVAVSLTATHTKVDGYAVVTPAGTIGPTSTVNWSRGETRASSSVVTLSSGGALDVHVSSSLDDVDVILDVTGAWVLVNGPVRGGRLVSLPARRVVDTRMQSAVAAGDAISLSKETLGVPAGAVAVAGTLTTSGATSAGYLTAYPVGEPVPITSNVNTDQAGQVRAAGIIVALGNEGLAVLAGAASADIILDVTGYVTGPSDPASTEGLLIAVPPRRVLDTRAGSDAQTQNVAVEVGEPFEAATVGGVIATITATDESQPGFASVSAFGALDNSSTTSVLNWPGDTSVAAMTVQGVPNSRHLSLTSSTPAAFIVDVTGYLLGANAPDGPELALPGSEILTTGTIVDTTGVGRPNGDPLALLSEVYATSVLAAGGAASIVTSEVPGGGAASVPNDPRSFPECGPEPRCILLSAEYWDSELRGGRDANRVMVSHEWAHVLSIRWQAWVDDITLSAWQPRLDRVNEECLADAVAALALSRAGLPGNETPTYVVHYMCDAYWAGLYGATAVPGMRLEATALASDLLAWAQGWGAAHGSL
jgi:hypothetical protein